jgi:hypothetical protein
MAPQAGFEPATLRLTAVAGERDAVAGSDTEVTGRQRVRRRFVTATSRHHNPSQAVDLDGLSHNLRHKSSSGTLQDCFNARIAKVKTRRLANCSLNVREDALRLTLV